MRKYLLVIVILLLSICLCGCEYLVDDEPSNIEGISNHLYYQIQKAKVKNLSKIGVEINTDDVEIIKFYGEYNGVYALFIKIKDTAELGVLDIVEIAGVKFVYPSPHSIEAYYEGDICSLSDLYKNGVLTKEDIVKIRDKYNELGGLN